MIIDKAIEILQLDLNHPFFKDYPDHADALKLGIEALKRITIGRLRHRPYSRLLLPSEDPE